MAKRPLTPAEKQRRYRARIKDEGGRAVHVFVDAEANAKLSAWEDAGETPTTIINRLLRRSRPPV